MWLNFATGLGSTRISDGGQVYNEKWGGVHGVTAESVQKSALDLKAWLCDSRVQNVSGWFGLALFCGMRYINDLPYLRRDKATLKTVQASPTKANWKLMAAKINSRTKYKKREVLQTVPPRIFTVVSEYFENFGVDYSF